MNGSAKKKEYLYIWNRPEEQCIIASGLEFKCIASELYVGGIILLEHKSEVGIYDSRSRFEYVPRERLLELSSEDIYSWGNFSWVDYSADVFPKIPPDEVAEIVYFKHIGKPLHKNRVESLDNLFLAQGHDDGWFLQLYYGKWESVWSLLSQLYPVLLSEKIALLLQEGSSALWINKDFIEQEEKTLDIDSVLNRRLL